MAMNHNTRTFSLLLNDSFTPLNAKLNDGHFTNCTYLKRLIASQTEKSESKQSVGSYIFIVCKVFNKNTFKFFLPSISEKIILCYWREVVPFCKENNNTCFKTYFFLLTDSKFQDPKVNFYDFNLFHLPLFCPLFLPSEIFHKIWRVKIANT
jgi:hypothetical protein